MYKRQSKACFFIIPQQSGDAGNGSMAALELCLLELVENVSCDFRHRLCPETIYCRLKLGQWGCGILCNLRLPLILAFNTIYFCIHVSDLCQSSNPSKQLGVVRAGRSLTHVDGRRGRYYACMWTEVRYSRHRGCCR